MYLVKLAVLIGALALATTPALAERGGNGNGNTHTASASCSVSDGVVSAVGLPTDEVVNFLITDDSGIWGWVLGMSDGTWSVDVPPANGSTSYAFVSRTWGPNGSKYNVFASCS